MKIIGVADVPAGGTGARSSVVDGDAHGTRTAMTDGTCSDAFQNLLRADAHLVLRALLVGAAKVSRYRNASVAAVWISSVAFFAMTLAFAMNDHALGVLGFTVEFDTGVSALLDAE